MQTTHTCQYQTLLTLHSNSTLTTTSTTNLQHLSTPAHTNIPDSLNLARTHAVHYNHVNGLLNKSQHDCFDQLTPIVFI